MQPNSVRYNGSYEECDGRRECHFTRHLLCTIVVQTIVLQMDVLRNILNMQKVQLEEQQSSF
jgi:hypothetical protein